MIAHVRGSVVLGYRARAGVDASVVEQQAQQAKQAGPPPVVVRIHWPITWVLFFFDIDNIISR